MPIESLMDIGFDRNGWANDPASRADGKTRSPEWHGLRARLVAASAARRALAMGDDVPAGSFDCVSARVLADYGQELSVVNPVFWANGKPVCSIDAAVAGIASPGDRG